jgi:type VII secretion integral membrane protein EccD
MPAPSTGLTRVTISSPQRRVDVALPDGVPLAELLPELLEHAGEAMPDDGERHGGWALRRADGTALSPGAAMTTQGVRDGAVLYLVPARAEWPELEYDDVVEAIAAGARRYGVGWSGRASRVTALVVAGLALAAGLVAVLRSGPQWTVPALAAFGAAAVLVLAGVVSSRAYGDVVAGATLAAGAMPYAFVGGLVLLAGSAALNQVKPWHLLDGAVALLVTALLGAVGAAYGLRLFVAGATAAVSGAVAGLLGLFTTSSGAAAAVLTVLVTGIAALPLLAIRLGKLPMPVVALPTDTPGASGRALEPRPERDRVFAAVARTDEMLTGMLLGIAVAALVSSAVLVRSPGIAGQLLVAVAAAAFLLRARLFVTIRHRVPLLAAGTGSYGLLATALITGQPSTANLAMVAGLVLAALVVAVAGARYAGRAPSPYLGRAADLLDALCVISVVPVACGVLNLFRLATGLISG